MSKNKNKKVISAQTPSKPISRNVFIVVIVVLAFVLYQNIINPLKLNQKLVNYLVAPSLERYLTLFEASANSETYTLLKVLGVDRWGSEFSGVLEKKEQSSLDQIVTLEKFIKTEGPSPQVLRYLGKLYRQIGKEKTAQIYEKKARDIDPLGK